MVVRSFPRLRPLPITIAWSAGDDLLWYSVENGHHRIRVNDCLRRASTGVLQGGMAHELCHVDADLRLGPYPRQLASGWYARSHWRRMHEERATEVHVIALGYGPQLLTFVRYARKLGYSFTREHGLLYPEIRRAVQGRQPVQ